MICSPYFFQTWSYTEQEKELQEKAPTFLKSLQAAAVSEQAMARNTTKQYASIVPGIMSAAGTLLKCRSDRMNAHATLTGLQLKSGGATKMTHTRLHRRSMSISYNTVIKKQVLLGVGFDKEVLEWKSQMEKDVEKIRDIRDRIQPLQDRIDQNEHEFSDYLEHKQLLKELKEALINRHPGYQTIGDNIDFSVDPRQFTMDQGRLSLHYFNFLAVKNRVSL